MRIGRIYGELYEPAGAYDTICIFAPGLNADGSEFSHYADAFTAAGIAFFPFDFYGGSMHTKSGGDMKAMSVFSEQADLQEVLDHFCGYRIFLASESMGSFVSLLAHSKDICGMIFWYPAFDLIRAKERALKVMPDVTLSAFFDEAVRQADILSRIEETRCPVLILQGDRDPIVPLADTEAYGQAFADARLCVIRGAGHGFEDVQCDEAVQRTLSFIRNH